MKHISLKPDSKLIARVSPLHVTIGRMLNRLCYSNVLKIVCLSDAFSLQSQYTSSIVVSLTVRPNESINGTLTYAHIEDHPIGIDTDSN